VAKKHHFGVAFMDLCDSGHITNKCDLRLFFRKLAVMQVMRVRNTLTFDVSPS
jgi:hypothetical protein